MQRLRAWFSTNKKNMYTFETGAFIAGNAVIARLGSISKGFEFQVVHHESILITKDLRKPMKAFICSIRDTPLKVLWNPLPFRSYFIIFVAYSICWAETFSWFRTLFSKLEGTLRAKILRMIHYKKIPHTYCVSSSTTG